MDARVAVTVGNSSILAFTATRVKSVEGAASLCLFVLDGETEPGFKKSRFGLGLIRGYCQVQGVDETTVVP